MSLCSLSFLELTEPPAPPSPVTGLKVCAITATCFMFFLLVDIRVSMRTPQNVCGGWGRCEDPLTGLPAPFVLSENDSTQFNIGRRCSEGSEANEKLSVPVQLLERGLATGQPRQYSET